MCDSSSQAVEIAERAQAPVRLEAGALDALLGLLRTDGYLTVGPKLHEQAIVYGEIGSLADLPQGWTDRQEKGHYRLEKRQDQAYFGYVVGPHSWKKYLYPPQELLLRAYKTEKGFELEDLKASPPRYAFIGVRACEVAAIAIQDKVFLDGPYRDPYYQARREGVLIVAVNCTEPGQTCFCVSMNTGPQLSQGYDLALTEMLEEAKPYYLIRAGSASGAHYLQALETTLASEACQALEAQRFQQAELQMGRQLNAQEAPQLLKAMDQHPYWQAVGERCLSCTNCTMVCPTCFCSQVEDTTDLSGQVAERHRHWDSCFSLNFTYTAGQPIRKSTASRYRQWISHKLAYWHDQFDVSGCVGCGRCITWCPVGIDITEEVATLQALKKEKDHGS